MVIQDDGKGFDVSKLTRVKKSGRGAGLFTMRERLHVAEGEGYVESKPGKGTRGIARISPFTRISRMRKIKVLIVDDHMLV